MEHGVNLLDLIPAVKAHHLNHVVGAGLVVIVLLLFGALARARLSAAKDPLIPEDHLSVRTVFELLVEFLLGICRSIIGEHHSEKYLPLLGGVFVYVLGCNLFGLIPGLSPPTGNISTNAGCAIVVLVMYNYYGFKEHGVGYLKHFAGPLWWLAWLFFPMELLSHLFRPVSLSMRLYGNMMADHMVVGIFTDLTKIGVPVFFYFLGLVVCILQAYIFTLLTAVYISLAVSHEH